MTDQNIMHPCFMCGSQFQMGEHIYDGKYIRRYDITVCMACWTVIGMVGHLTMKHD